MAAHRKDLDDRINLKISPINLRNTPKLFLKVTVLYKKQSKS